MKSWLKFCNQKDDLHKSPKPNHGRGQVKVWPRDRPSVKGGNWGKTLTAFLDTVCIGYCDYNPVTHMALFYQYKIVPKMQFYHLVTKYHHMTVFWPGFGEVTILNTYCIGNDGWERGHFSTSVASRSANSWPRRWRCCSSCSPWRAPTSIKRNGHWQGMAPADSLFYKVRHHLVKMVWLDWSYKLCPCGLEMCPTFSTDATPYLRYCHII